jgi:hypothetical protein
MTDKELIEAIKKLDAEIADIKSHIKISNGILEDTEDKRQTLVNELMLRMRAKPKKIFCFGRKKSRN